MTLVVGVVVIFLASVACDPKGVGAFDAIGGNAAAVDDENTVDFAAASPVPGFARATTPNEPNGVGALVDIGGKAAPAAEEEGATESVGDGLVVSSFFPNGVVNRDFVVGTPGVEPTLVTVPDEPKGVGALVAIGGKASDDLEIDVGCEATF